MIRVLAHLDRESATAHRLGDDPGSLSQDAVWPGGMQPLKETYCDLYCYSDDIR